MEPGRRRVQQQAFLEDDLRDHVRHQTWAVAVVLLPREEVKQQISVAKELRDLVSSIHRALMAQQDRAWHPIWTRRVLKSASAREVRRALPQAEAGVLLLQEPASLRRPVLAVYP